LQVILTIISCETANKDLPNYRKKRVVVDEAFQVESYYSQGAKVKGKLTAPYMINSHSDSSYIEFPKTLHVDFYNDSLKVESQLDALYGRYKENEDKVFLRDSVIVKNIVKGDTLRCNELWWDKRKQQFNTDKPARINKRDGTVIYAAAGLDAAEDFNWYRLHQIIGKTAVPENTVPK
jgi:LPS export ABC transporter protein LptC